MAPSVTRRQPECHSGRKHKAKGLCQDCYFAAYRAAHLGEKAAHNAARTPEFRAWMHARTRTTNPNYVGWRYYGERGIRMCQLWLSSFQAFLDELGPKPGPEYSLDRIDNERGYEPGNCRWATPMQQAANRRPRSTAVSVAA